MTFEKFNEMDLGVTYHEYLMIQDIETKKEAVGSWLYIDTKTMKYGITDRADNNCGRYIALAYFSKRGASVIILESRTSKKKNFISLKKSEELAIAITGLYGW